MKGLPKALARSLTGALTLYLLLASASTMAATARDGFSPALDAADAAPRHAGTDSVALAAAVQEMQSGTAAKPTHPMQFAVGAEIPLELADGQWDTSSDGSPVWRMRVASDGSTLLGVSFAQLQLPPSARLYFYDLAASTVQGPYTAAEVGTDGTLVTAVVPGAEAVIELRVDRAELDRVQLKLGRIYHGFRAFPGRSGSEAITGKSLTSTSAASCEINVACPAGDNWSDQIRSVALLQVGNSSGLFLCSGQLVNDLRNDNTPYFLTAHHCQIGASSTTPASSVVVYWNYQASTCSGTGGSLNQTSSGSSLIATDAGSDFALIQLSQTPPSSYDVYYAGWDVSATAVPSSGVAIHHPEADIKKISTYSTPASRSNNVQLELSNGSTQAIKAWMVSWSAGITEEGSSGSGLWNQDQHVIGVLSGGNTACASSSPGNTSSTGVDFFGRLDAAWTANTTSGGQLKAWLDPENTGITCTDGRNPTDGAASTACSPVGANSGTGAGSSTAASSGGSGSPTLMLVLAPLAWLRYRRSRRT